MNDQQYKEKPKQPWLAVFLSALLPGAGQIYGGNKSKGISFVFIFILLFLIAVTSFIGFLFLDDAETSRWFALISVSAGFIIFIFSIFVLFDAYKVAKKYNAKHHLNIKADIKKKAWLAVFLSYIFPGIGQFYNKQLLKGISFVICAIFLYIVHIIFYSSFFLLLPLYFFAIKDAFDSAEKINGSDQKFIKQGDKLVRIFVALVLLIEFIPFRDITKAHFIQAYKFPSGSMMPSLLIGDHILADKTTRAKNSVKKGDIIVFKYPEDSNRDFIKRVVGIGGETIESKDKKIYINGKLIEEPYVQHTNNSIFPKEVGPRDNFGPFAIPENSLFVMGDNRDGSHDSRFWKYVPKDYIIGKAFKIYWSWDSENSKVRWDRIGMKIR